MSTTTNKPTAVRTWIGNYGGVDRFFASLDVRANGTHHVFVTVLEAGSGLRHFGRKIIAVEAYRNVNGLERALKITPEQQERIAAAVFQALPV